MTWLPKSVVCLSYYDRFRFRSDAFAALVLALQIFPLVVAVAVATGVPPLYGALCPATAGLLASVCGDSKIRVTARDGYRRARRWPASPRSCWYGSTNRRRSSPKSRANPCGISGSGRAVRNHFGSRDLDPDHGVPNSIQARCSQLDRGRHGSFVGEV